ncbi:MAG TPA: nicotinate-nucleotide adenylyltransferase [Vicinamibacterales bacterium]|nr:nicotinate-nucleotide adenylyltransferase [Vicinamibacterales bacterium]
MMLGVLGGTFDPIHNGHLAAADAAQRELQLDAVTLVPSRIPPHRDDPVGASAEHRYAMAALAAVERPGWTVSRTELEREGPSFTYDTLVELQKTGSQLFFILGADAFAEIATWSRYPAVLDLANFVVVSRPGVTLNSLRERVPSAFSRRPSAKTRVILVEAHTPDVSSTEIRRRIRAGERLTALVPDSVASYIHQHRLYVGH